MTDASGVLLRTRDGHGHARVTYVELFFDLVFVFAITQLSHTLLEHLTPGGLLQTALMFLAVWWVWINTSWVTNWLDPERTSVRLALFVLMLAGLVLSTSIPYAFTSGGLAFAGAYVSMQVGRTLFMLWALKGPSPGNYRNFQRILCWLLLSGTFWLLGAFADGSNRLLLWAIALAIESSGPGMRFWTPGLGASSTSDWDVEGGHLAERCALFVIIALGESVLVTGTTFGKLAWTPATIGAFLTVFAGSVAMWWIYFNIGAERGSRHIAESSDPGRLGRLSYTYIHILLVAGIIVVAVGDELVLAHPEGHIDLKTALVLLGGPVLYLAGNMLFKRVSANNLPLSHLVGLGLIVLLIPTVPVLSPLALSAATTLVLVIVAIWETRSFSTPRVA